MPWVPGIGPGAGEKFQFLGLLDSSLDCLDVRMVLHRTQGKLGRESYKMLCVFFLSTLRDRQEPRKAMPVDACWLWSGGHYALCKLEVCKDNRSSKGCAG